MPSPIRRLPPFAVGCAVVALTTALTGPAWADPAPSFRTLLERIGASPSAAEADALLEAAEARVRQARVRPNPTAALEAENAFEGMSQVAASLKRNPRLWPRLRNPLRPSWGEPYRAQAARMLAVVDRIRADAVAADGPGAESVLVSHQLPIWVTRLAVEGRPLWHDPRRRECSLTSVTSLVFDEGRTVPRVEYHEPNQALLKDASSLPGA